MAKYSTFDQFIKAHLGKAVDFDGEAKAQCVDLVEAYFNELFGSGIKNFWWDAHHFWELFDQNSWLKKNFTKIANTASFVPKKGDVMVWSGALSSGGWGHIAICSGEGNTSYFYSYDQNWTGRNDPCTKIKHNYNAVYGVLRPKDQTKINPPVVLKALDTKGMKQGDINLGVYELKSLLSLAEAKKIISTHITVDSGYGAGTTSVVNSLLKKWGYKQNGIAGENFVRKLTALLK